MWVKYFLCCMIFPTDGCPVYFLHFQELDTTERILWGQFILSQLVRTPTFMRYEKYISNVLNLTDVPKHDRVGCKNCADINFIANRDWCLLLAHEDDYFVRTDNPILQTGFIERSKTCLYYPLSPRLCFVACSMPNDWNAFLYKPKDTCGYKLEKGGAHLINFNFAKTADNTLIISPKHDGLIADSMFSDVLGLYPQPPFPLHRHQQIDQSNVHDAYESINSIMSVTDGIKYPPWLPEELEPFYQSDYK